MCTINILVEQSFRAQRPCGSTEVVEFGKRIRSEGIELILKEIVRVSGKDANVDILSGTLETGT